jgi:hypothetical protein
VISTPTTSLAAAIVRLLEKLRLSKPYMVIKIIPIIFYLEYIFLKLCLNLKLVSSVHILARL